MTPFKIFVVEDDKWYGELLQHHLSLNPEYEIELFESGSDLLKNIYKKPSVITLDYSLPDIKGVALLKRIREHHPDIPIVMISGQEDISTAISLLKEGAYDYIVKNEETKDRLWRTMKNIRDSLALKNENILLKEELTKKYEISNTIIGNSPAIRQVFTLIEKAANTNISVSVTGETGTGKELVARAVHYNSARSKYPFVAINVGAIPRDLIESELFGHEKGSFTGANSRRIGKFEEANKGTIFLDEICELDFNLQSKILRVLQEKEITRIGSNTPIKIDSRVIVATHRNLAEETKNGNFREDLYYRLLGLPIKLPPLRERGNDILLLTKYFADAFSLENNTQVVSFTAAAQRKLLEYAWPGNVRQLKAIVELAITMSNDAVIDADDIVFDDIRTVANFFSDDLSLDDYIYKIIDYYLEKNDQNVVEVANSLRIGKSTIYRMFKRFPELKK
ncbi:MAG: sigma-54 dependent transcriptional regulator [Bacteroidota bacterium]|nr:sigma-54 dependent transcriptional regulator [Bacteroidota bacterium]